MKRTIATILTGAALAVAGAPIASASITTPDNNGPSEHQPCW